jgi:hypothetical protein
VWDCTAAARVCCCRHHRTTSCTAQLCCASWQKCPRDYLLCDCCAMPCCAVLCHAMPCCAVQCIQLEAHAIKGVGREHAKWSPVATAWYRLQPEVVLLQPVTGAAAKVSHTLSHVQFSGICLSKLGRNRCAGAWGGGVRAAGGGLTVVQGWEVLLCGSMCCGVVLYFLCLPNVLGCLGLWRRLRPCGGCCGDIEAYFTSPAPKQHPVEQRTQPGNTLYVAEVLWEHEKVLDTTGLDPGWGRRGRAR